MQRKPRLLQHKLWRRRTKLNLSLAPLKRGESLLKNTVKGNKFINGVEAIQEIPKLEIYSSKQAHDARKTMDCRVLLQHF